MKVLVGQIVWRSVESANEVGIIDLCRMPGVQFHQHAGDALVERARGAVAYHFLEETDADILLTIDSDIMFDPAQAMLLCEQAMEMSIICGLYVTRARGERCRPACALKIGQTIECGTDATPVEIQWPASGFCAMHRRVFDALKADPSTRLMHPNTNLRFYPFYVPFEMEDDAGNPILLSEDYAIGERARRLGFPTYLNPAVRLGHVGVKVYTLMDAFLPANLRATPVRISQPAPYQFRMEGAIAQSDAEQFPALGARAAIQEGPRPPEGAQRPALWVPGAAPVVQVRPNGGPASKTRPIPIRRG